MIKKKLWAFKLNLLFFTECDRACEGCTGDGPDLCYKCADGYELRNGLCTGRFSEMKFSNSNFALLNHLKFSFAFLVL